MRGLAISIIITLLLSQLISSVVERGGRSARTELSPAAAAVVVLSGAPSGVLHSSTRVRLLSCKEGAGSDKWAGELP